MRKFKMAALFVALTVLTVGCSTQGAISLPPDQAQAQRVAQCNRAESLVAIASSSAALAVAKKSQETKDYVAVTVRALRAGVSDYCEKVISGQDPAAIDSALKGVQVGLDDLTDRLLAPSPA